MGKLLSVILKKKQPANKQHSQQQQPPPDTEFVDNFTNLASIDQNPDQQETARSSNEYKNRIEKIKESSGVMNVLKEENNFDSFENVLSVATATSNGSSIVFGQDDYSVVLFDFVKNKRIKIWKGHEKDITKVVYCSKIDRYLTASRDKSIKLWSIDSPNSLLNMLGHELVVTAIATNPENTHLVSGSRDNTLFLWDLARGVSTANVQISRNLITDVCWSYDSKILLQTSEDKEVKVWDPLSLKQIYSFPKKQYIQSSCHISLDNNYAISTSNGFQGNGCEITVWDLRSRAMLAELYGHDQTVTCAKLVYGDKYISSCSNDSTVRLWDFKTHKLVDTLYLSNTLTSLTESMLTKKLLVSSLSNGIYQLGF